MRLLDGRLSLITPEGVRLLLTPAGPYLRAVSWMIDFFVWFTAVSIMHAILGTSKLAQGVGLIITFLTYWGYPVICEVYFGGRTLGKRATGLEVVRADGLPVGWRESTLRNLLQTADFLPFLYLSGLICMMLDVKFRRIGDIVAGTIVIHRDAKPRRSAAQSAAPLAPPFPLNADQQRTLADLFERETSLPLERLAELGTIAEPLTGKTGAASVDAMRGYVAGFSK
jgi:uncharacterized RDD family membrane protein YckC